VPISGGYCFFSSVGIGETRIAPGNNDPRHPHNGRAGRAVCNPDLELRAAARRFIAAARNDVTVPVSALHQGHGRTGGRTGFRTPNRSRRSAAQLTAATG
jgi:hypothetical protein